MFTYILLTIVATIIIAAFAFSNRTPSISANLAAQPSSLGTDTTTTNKTVSSIISRRRAPSFSRRIQNENGIWGWFEDGIWVQDIVQDMLDEVAYMALFGDDGMFIENMMDSDVHSDAFTSTEITKTEVESIVVNETPTFTPTSEPTSPEPTMPSYEAPSAPAYDPPSYSGGSSYDSGGSSGGSDSGGGSFD